MKHNASKTIWALGFGVAALLLGAGVVCVTLPGYAQMNGYFSTFKKIRAGDSGAVERLKDPDGLFSPYTYVQPDLRNDLLNRIIDVYQQQPGAPIVSALPSSIDQLIEVTRQRPLYPKYFVSVAKGYGLLNAIDPGHPEHLNEGEAYYKRAAAIMPGNPEIGYGYTVNLLNQNRLDEALQFARQTVENDPRVGSSHHYLGLVFYRMGPKHYIEALEEFEYAFTLQNSPELKSAVEVYQKLFSYFYQTKDLPRLATTIDRLIIIDWKQKETYVKIRDHIRQTKTIPLIRMN